MSYLAQFEVVPAIESFLKAKDHSQYANIITQAENNNEWDRLIQFIQMAR